MFFIGCCTNCDLIHWYNTDRRQKRETYDFLIGEEEHCDGMSELYCNGYLKPDNEYR